MSDTKHFQLIEDIIDYLIQHADMQPSLATLAAKSGYSEGHLQRIFTAWAGVSPKQFLKYLTRQHLTSVLEQTSNLAEAADAVGLSSQSRVHDLFVTLDAMTPEQYKKKGETLRIDYGFYPTPFGEALLANTSRGVCALRFVDDKSRDDTLAELHKKWSGAEFVLNTAKTNKVIDQIFLPLTQQQKPAEKLQVVVKGTHFQLKVWEALLLIPSGQVASYAAIANAIGQATAQRAVGTAIGQNPIAWLIPCHRVIQKQGVIGNYRWGTKRKMAILGKEQANYIMESS